MPLLNRTYRSLLQAVMLITLTSMRPGALAPDPRLRVVVGVTATGDATDQWLAMIRKRLAAADFQKMARLRKPLTRGEQAWLELVRSRVATWESEIPALAALFQPISPPDEVSIVLGNRGGDDAFTHDPPTIGFDLAVLQSTYGDAALPENGERITRFFRHEYVHLLQKAWFAERPYPLDSPLRMALAARRGRCARDLQRRLDPGGDLDGRSRQLLFAVRSMARHRGTTFRGGCTSAGDT